MTFAHRDERREKLDRTWTLMADAILRGLEAGEPSASMLDVARRWLSENGVTLSALRDWRSDGLGNYGPLPVFNDDDDEGGQQRPASADPALTKVPPFAPED